MGGQERGISPFPLTSISSPFYQSLISQTLTPDSSSSFGRFTSSEDRWKASAQLEGEEDCEVLTTMGSYSPSMRLHKFVLFYIKVYAVHASKLIRFANKRSMFHNYVPRYYRFVICLKQSYFYIGAI